MKINTGHKVTAVFAALLMVFSILILPTGTALAEGETTPMLSALSVVYGTNTELLTGFVSDKYEYTINAAYSASVNGVHINATALDAGDTVEGDGDHALNTGGNTVTVNAKRGSITSTPYTIIINVAETASSDCSLKSLTVTNGKDTLDLNPAFDALTTEYTLATTARHIDIDAAANYAPYATVSGLGGFDLAGDRTFTVTVTAEDGTTKDYSIAVTYQKSSNADLKSLSVKHGNTELLDKSKPELTFDPATTSYNIDTDAMDIVISAEAEDAFATVAKTNIGNKTLKDEANTFKITVTAEDGTTKDYNLTVNCDAGKNAYLKSLSVSASEGGKPYTLTPAFSPDVNKYAVKVRSDITDVFIDCETEYDYAQEDSYYDYALKVGNNKITIGVYSKDSLDEYEDEEGSAELEPDNTYTITITRDAGASKTDSNGFKYVFDGENAVITGYKGKAENITIPSTEESKPVTSIGMYAFMGNTTIKKVTIPNGVKDIESGAFEGCNNLKNVTFPEGLETIEDAAFAECENLSSVDLKSGLTEIGTGAFGLCFDLRSVTLPDGLKSISNEAFFACVNLTEINIPKGVTAIGDGAFVDCQNLKNVTLSEGLKSISNELFAMCTSLEEINIPIGVTEIGADAFVYCESLENVTLPEGLKVINDEAFAACVSLSSITLPDGLETLGSACFGSCQKITSLAIPDSVSSIGDYFLTDCIKLDSITTNANTNFRSQDGILFAVKEDKLAELVRYPSAKSGDDYTVPDTVTKLWIDSFESSKLKTVTVKTGVGSIPNDCFANCASLTSITLPDSVEGFGDYAFYHCTSLPNFTIPKNVSEMGEGVFGGDTSLTKILVAEGNGSYKSEEEEGVLYNISEDTLVIYPAGKTDESFTVPSTVKEISESAFESSKIKNIDLGTSLERIDTEAFVNCNYLTRVSIPDSTYEIEDYAFDSCMNLSSATIGKNVTDIGSDTFTECPRFTAVYFLGNAPDVDGGMWLDGAKGRTDKTDKGFTKAFSMLHFNKPSVKAYNEKKILKDMNSASDIKALNIKAFEDYYDGGDDGDYEGYSIFSGCSGYLTVYRAAGTKYFGKASQWNGRKLSVFDPKKTCTVKFNMNGKTGTAPANETVYKTGKAVQPLDPVTEGSIFFGWYREASCKNKWNFDKNTVKGTVTLYAKWETSENAYLKDLSGYLLNEGYAYGNLVISPSFNPLVYKYTAALDEDTDSFGIVPMALYNGATVTIDGESVKSKAYYVDNGQSVKSVITVKSGKLTRTYTLTVTRAKSTDNYLSDIKCTTVADGEEAVLSPEFDTYYKDYTLSIGENAPSVIITPVKEDSHAKVYIDGKAKTSKEYKVVNGGSASCTIKVVSQSGKSRTYTIEIKRDKSTNTNLSKLKTNSSKYPVTPVLDNTKTQAYTVTIPDNVSSVTLYAVPEGYGAKTKITCGKVSSKKGYLKVSPKAGSVVDVKVTVTAQKSTTASPITREYNIKVYHTSYITSFSASPVVSKYPSLSPGGENRLTFNWKQSGTGKAEIQVNTGTEWKTIYTDTDEKVSGKYRCPWDGKVDGSYLVKGTYQARISVSYGDGLIKSSYYKLNLKILDPIK